MNEEITQVYQQVKTGVPIRIAVYDVYGTNKDRYYREASKQEKALIRLAGMEYRERFKMSLSNRGDVGKINIDIGPDLKMQLYALAAAKSTDASVLIRSLIRRAVNEG